MPEIEKLGKEIDNLGGFSELSAGKQQLLQEKITDVNGVMGEEAVRIDDFIMIAVGFWIVGGIALVAKLFC